MDFSTAKTAVLDLLSKVESSELPKLVQWLRVSNELDECCTDNNDIILKSIAEDLRSCLPVEAMVKSEPRAIQKMQKNPEPTIHVDAFLYDEEFVDSLCEEGKMSRNYCLNCGSHNTSPLDLTGKVLVDVGSRLGAVLYGGYLYSSASQLVGVEINADFCQLQQMAITKYHFKDRIQVVHADICSQSSLLQNADVIVMNNVFEYFLDAEEQSRAWQCVSQHTRKKGALLLTVPSLQESIERLQFSIQLNQWVEEVPLDYEVYLGQDTDADALKQVHLYRIL
ncbi:uncharacterized protein LOC117422159 isoform X2 [Acipenser ruthenus]|uniref:uncharacterized protein LOC117422159 isoform X2 n=1 Tax=Acipenser ruthenus TaxID=7906 RepID=UPI00274095B6|nr:uncharacterized protein LOC117422159 isoform X2 [Acipenser ruthenus]